MPQPEPVQQVQANTTSEAKVPIEQQKAELARKKAQIQEREQRIAEMKK